MSTPNPSVEASAPCVRTRADNTDLVFEMHTGAWRILPRSWLYEVRFDPASRGSAALFPDISADTLANSSLVEVYINQACIHILCDEPHAKGEGGLMRALLSGKGVSITEHGERYRQTKQPHTTYVIALANQDLRPQPQTPA